MEIWRDIPGYIGLYQASSEGRIRSVLRLSPHAVASGIRIQKKILTPAQGYAGRLRVALSMYSEVKKLQVHRLVLMAFKGMPDGDLDGLHDDGNHLNNRPGNLRWGTHTDSMRDKRIHGTQTEGETAPGAKLTEDAVRAIRASKETSRALGKRYGVSQVAIVFIKNRKTWKHVE